jgi:hypothetical protein
MHQLYLPWGIPSPRNMSRFILLAVLAAVTLSSAWAQALPAGGLVATLPLGNYVPLTAWRSCTLPHTDTHILALDTGNANEQVKFTLDGSNVLTGPSAAGTSHAIAVQASVGVGVESSTSVIVYGVSAYQSITTFTFTAAAAAVAYTSVPSLLIPDAANPGLDIQQTIKTVIGSDCTNVAEFVTFVLLSDCTLGTFSPSTGFTYIAGEPNYGCVNANIQTGLTAAPAPYDGVAALGNAQDLSFVVTGTPLAQSVRITYRAQGDARQFRIDVAFSSRTAITSVALSQVLYAPDSLAAPQQVLATGAANTELTISTALSEKIHVGSGVSDAREIYTVSAGGSHVWAGNLNDASVGPAGRMLILHDNGANSELIVLNIVALAGVIVLPSTGDFLTMYGTGLVLGTSLSMTFDANVVTSVVNGALTVDHTGGPSADITIDFGTNSYNFDLNAPGAMITLLSPVNSITIVGGTFVNTGACLVDGAAANHIILHGSDLTTDTNLLCAATGSFSSQTTTLHFLGVAP